MPALLSHNWVEVEIEGKWRRFDSDINDMAFYTAAKKALREKWHIWTEIEQNSSPIVFELQDEKAQERTRILGQQGTQL